MGPLTTGQLFILILAALVSTSRTAETEVKPACVDAVGAHHRLGDSYLGPDGCNTCQCIEAGNSCTRMLCESSSLGRSASEDPALLPQCEDVDGTKHKLGESYIGPDNCNTCRCLEGGNACTRKLCPPEITSRKAEANRCVDNMGVLHNSTEAGKYLHPDGCNTCTCLEGDLPACTKRLCLKFQDYVMEKCISHEGRAYGIGEAWLHQDGCAQCVCGVIGPICNSNYCPWDKNEGRFGKDDDVVVFKHGIVSEEGDTPCNGEDGNEHMPGSSWLSGDGCNSCTCPGNGDAVCTEEGCRVGLERLIQRDPQLKGLEPGMEGSGATQTMSHGITLMLIIGFVSLVCSL